MARISFHGSFYTGDPLAVERVLRSWLSLPDLTMKNRRGFELHYDSGDGIEVLCYESMLPEGANFFLVEGHIDDTVDAAATSLRGLAVESRIADIGFDGEYEVVDEDGNPLGPETDIE